jgi:Multicopper oxidase
MLQINNNNNRLQNKFINLIIAVATISILFANMESNLIKIYAQDEEASSPSIDLTAKLVDNQYRWVGSNNFINPTLNITSGVDNQIMIKSIEDDPEEHELIIEGIPVPGNKEGEELIASDEIEDGSSATVNFNPSDVEETNDYQSLEYYCEYHPDTMRGKFQIN